MTTEAKITLVGAGPGDPELITLKGLKAIQSAQVILYDALVNPILLEEASPKALKIYVGKRANVHQYSQAVINELLVQYALSKGHVVRLKGGDSFVFGRGYEELNYAQGYGIEVEVVPGISSAIAVPALQAVPLTCRGINESFWVLTGTTKSGQLSKDIALAATASTTVVILMGMRKINQIVQLFIAAGKRDTPVLVTQNGSRKNEKSVVGTVETIVDLVKVANIGTPGIIIIGEVVALHPNFPILEKDLVYCV